MKNLVIYVHGKGGNAKEAEHFKHKKNFPSFLKIKSGNTAK